MSVRRLTYLDLSPEQRRHGADQARQKLKGILTNPFLTPEQVASVHQQLEHIEQWEKGLLPLPQDQN